MLMIYGYNSEVRKCVHCDNAKRFCDMKGIPFEFMSVAVGKVGNDIEFDNEVVAELLHRLGRDSKVGLTMPQIFREDTGEHIGGFSELRTYKF